MLRMVDLLPNPATATASCARHPVNVVVERHVSGDYFSWLGPTAAEEMEETAALFTMALLSPPLIVARMVDVVSSSPPPPLLPLLSLMILLTCHQCRGFVDAQAAVAGPSVFVLFVLLRMVPPFAHCPTRSLVGCTPSRSLRRLLCAWLATGFFGSARYRRVCGSPDSKSRCNGIACISFCAR